MDVAVAGRSVYAIGTDGTPWVIGMDKAVYYHDRSQRIQDPAGTGIAVRRCTDRHTASAG